jgi:plasmid stability protein
MVYSVMHRTQVLLEEWQYEMLKARAERESRSIGEIVREILGRALSQPRVPETQRGLSAIAGIVNEPGLSGRDHDDAIYGPKRTPR